MPVYKSTPGVSDNYHICPCIIGPLEYQIITIYAIYVYKSTPGVSDNYHICPCIIGPLEYQIITIYASV